mmetsp:Transcript_24873/g.38731  ORF Transcript_24873/g.38731 Transcript_24873/m.38731 type:complete len:128 (-) Transcript_24873:92-475(-)
MPKVTPKASTKSATSARKKTPVVPKKTAATRKKTPVKKSTAKTSNRSRSSKKEAVKVVQTEERKPRMSLRSSVAEETRVSSSEVANLICRFLFLMAVQVLMVAVVYYLVYANKEAIKCIIQKYLGLF